MFEPMKFDGTCGTCTFYRWQFEDCLACSENGSPVVGNEPCRYPAERHVAIRAQTAEDGDAELGRPVRKWLETNREKLEIACKSDFRTKEAHDIYCRDVLESLRAALRAAEKEGNDV